MASSSGRRPARPLADVRPLHPSDFSFYGFGELSSDEERRICRLEIRRDTPAVSVVDGAVFVPSTPRRGAGGTKFSGGVVTADGQPIDTAHLRRKRGKQVGGVVAPVAVTPKREVDEEVVYLGPLFNHFGRVLLESLARVWFLREVDPSVKVVFDHAGGAPKTPAAWLVRVLELFGIPLARIIVLDAPTRLRRAIVPEPLFEQNYAAHEGMIRPYRDVASTIAGDVKPTAQPVYLSRRLLTCRQRAIIGEGELEDVLRENGFLIAHPETMTIDDQIRLVNGHTDIFASVGSAAHSVLFALGKPRLHLLASGDDIPANYYLCSALAEAPTTFVNCLGAGDRPSPSSERRLRRAGRRGGEPETPVEGDIGTQAMPQVAEMSRFVAYLEERGFLNTRLRASLAGRNPALRDQYDEAWFYARFRRGAAKDGTLPAEIESEALRLAASSWPVSLILARYYARARDRPRVDAMVQQFAALAAAESDMNRLAHYRADVESFAPKVARMCRAETTGRFAQVASDRFLVGSWNGDGASPE